MATRPRAAASPKPSPARRRSAGLTLAGAAPGQARARVEAFTLDHQQAMEGPLGAGRGLSWTALRGAGPALAAAREQVHAAHAEGATPLLVQLGAERAAAALALAERWHQDHDRIIVFGEASGVAALAISSGDTPSERLRWASGPSTAALRAGLVGADRPLILLVGTAEWVGWSAQAAAPGAPVHALSAAEDGVFAPWSLESLALGAWSGADPAAAVEACSAAYARGRALHTDIARRISGLSAQFDARLSLGRLDLCAMSELGARVAAVGAQAWAAVVCKAQVSGAMRQPGADAPRTRRLGDEGDLQRLFEGPSDAWTLLLEELSAAHGPGLAPLADAEAALATGQGRAWTRLRFAEGDPAVALAITLILLEAALTVAMLRRASPLEMPTADRFREGLSLGPHPALDVGAPAPQES